jgi:putative SOS response-associated peptidase YedK
MCGRYTFHHSKQVGKRFEVSKVPSDVQDRYNVAPGQFMPVVTETDGNRELEIMKWGLVPRWSKDMNIGYKLINARAESAFEKPMWRSVIKRQRCLIPADGFYEWKRLPEGTKVKKQPYYIRPKDYELFAFAGIWETWKDSENNEWKTYSILTTEPNKEMASIHNRMPVILHQDDESSWLSHSHDDDRGAIEALLRPWEDDGLEMYETSTDVNVTKNDDEELIYPLNSQ